MEMRSNRGETMLYSAAAERGSVAMVKDAVGCRCKKMSAPQTISKRGPLYGAARASYHRGRENENCN